MPRLQITLHVSLVFVFFRLGGTEVGIASMMNEIALDGDAA